MTRYLLDTNIISDSSKPQPSEALGSWMEAQEDQQLFIASWTLAEIWRGVLDKPEGRKRRELESWFLGSRGPLSLFAGRVLPFGEKAGLIWARLMADGKQEGRPRDPLDMIIAATAEAHDCVIVTDNERHFRGFDVLNPLRRT